MYKSATEKKRVSDMKLALTVEWEELNKTIWVRFIY